MLTFDQIKELIELVAARRLHDLEIERAGFRLKIAGQNESQVAAGATAPAPAPRPVEITSVTALPVPAGPTGATSVTPATQIPPAASEATPEAGLHTLTSPIVGTFYAAPSPDADPYVRVGDRVRKGQVLCIVEAMKLMNEIESDVDGLIIEIYPKNAQPVEFGEPLFGVRPE